MPFWPPGLSADEVERAGRARDRLVVPLLLALLRERESNA